jgi:hypothetical protein
LLLIDVSNHKKITTYLGAKAVFTGKQGSHQQISLLVVGVLTTAANQISHLLLKASSERQEFKPWCYIPTLACISTKPFERGIFGVFHLYKLGLFTCPSESRTL